MARRNAPLCVCEPSPVLRQASTNGLGLPE